MSTSATPAEQGQQPHGGGGYGRTRRRAISRGVALALLPGATWIAACGAQSEGQRASGTQQAPVTLRYAGPFTPRPSNTFAEGVTKIIDAFNAQSKNVTVKWEEPKPLAEGILAQVAGGDAPDLVHSHPRDYVPYADVVREKATPGASSAAPWWAWASPRGRRIRTPPGTTPCTSPAPTAKRS